MHLTYKYRLLPTRKQHEALIAILDSQRVLYNAARVILSRAGMGPGALNVTGCGARAPGKLTEVSK